MFIEPHVKRENKGWVEIICGPMFSGKTEELIRRLKRAQIAKKTVQIYKPATDTRYHESDIVSHDDNIIPSTPVNHSNEILLLSNTPHVVAIDEAQFFDEGITAVCSELALRGSRVIVAGLDMDSNAQPFGPMPQLLAIAEYVTKLQAICMACGDMASFSYRKSGGESQTMLGSKDSYEPRCRSCFFT